MTVKKWDGTPEDLDRCLREFPPTADLLASIHKRCPGHTAFNLYSTHGIPIEMTIDFFERKGWTVDVQEFERLLEADRKRSRKASKFRKQIFKEDRT